MSTFIIADNQDISRAGIRLFIQEACPGCAIVDAFDKKGIVESLQRHAEGIVVFDYALSDIKSVDECLVMQKRFPESFWFWLSSDLSEGVIRRAGAGQRTAIVLKECGKAEILEALRSAASGRNFFCRQIAGFLDAKNPARDSSSVLTPSEVDILKLIAAGKTVKEIAAIRCSSAHTIITHKKNIFRKIDASNVYEATKYALRAGLVEMMEYYI